MCRMSVFVGGCTVESAAAVALDPDDAGEAADQDRSFVALELLARLAAKSLVVVDRGSPTRYRQLESIRLYARERLAASGDTSRRSAAAPRLFRRACRRRWAAAQGYQMPATLRRLDPEAENLRAAIEWALDVDLDTAMRMCVDLATYGRARSLSDDFQLLSRVAARIGPNADAEPMPLVAHFLGHGRQFCLDGGQRVSGSAVGGARPGDRPPNRRPDGEGRCADGAGDHVHVPGPGRRGHQWTDEANKIYAESGDWTARAFAEAGTSQWEAERGNVAGAAARLASAAQAAERSGSPEVIAFTALSRGRVAGISGQVEEARAAFATAIEAYGEIGDHGLVLVARSDLAHALRHSGLAEESDAVYRETLPAWQHTGNRGAIEKPLESVAMLAAERQPKRPSCSCRQRPGSARRPMHLGSSSSRSSSIRPSTGCALVWMPRPLREPGMRGGGSGPRTPDRSPSACSTDFEHPAACDDRGHATSGFGLVTEEVAGTGPLGTHPVIRVEQSAGAQGEATAADAAGQAVTQSFEFDDALIETITPGS